MIRPFKPVLCGCVPIVVALATALMAPPAAAQLNDLGAAQKARTPTPKAETKQDLPPALPGATQQRDTAIPSNGPTTGMSPNDLLFDAINRGDIADARDALSRGADLEARNILGLTPIDGPSPTGEEGPGSDGEGAGAPAPCQPTSRSAVASRVPPRWTAG